MEAIYWILLAVVYVSVSAAVSIFLFKRDDLDTFQKFAQTILSWIIPVIGAFIFWRLNKSHDIQYKAAKGFGGGTDSRGHYDSAGDGGGSD